MPRWARLLLPSITDVIFLAILLPLSYGVVSQKLLGDADTGWHIRDGQQIVRSYSVPRTDSFSSTMSGKRWYAWEWLYDAVIGLIYNGAGLNGVVFFSAFLIALTFALLFRVEIRAGTSMPVAVVFLLFSAAASTIHFLARPHIISWLVTLIWVRVLDANETDAGTTARRNRGLFWLPVLMLLWVNVHGGFLIGFVLLGLYLIAACIQNLGGSDSKSRTAAVGRVRRLLWISFLCALASFVNPYGYHLHAHVYGYLSNQFLMNHIQEFQSANFHDLAPRCFIVLLLIAFFTLSVSSRRVRPSQILLLLFATYSGLSAARNIPIAAILITIAVAPLLSGAIKDIAVENAAGLRSLASRVMRLTERAGTTEFRQYGHIWPVLILLFGGWVCAHQGRLGPRSLMHAEFNASRFPVKAAELIRTQGISEPIFTLDSWGGYLIYRLYPQVKVVVDDRHDLYGMQFFKEYLKVIHVEPEWKKILNDWNVNLIVLPADSALSSTLKQTPPWKILDDDGVAIVFQRAR